MHLLDVNALLALRYATNVHHERVHQWISQLHEADFRHVRDHRARLVRVGSGKAGYVKDLATAREDLEDLKSSMDMLFLPADLPTRHLPTWVRKADQTTDGYLLALAKSHGADLATLDRFIPGSVFISEEPTGPIMVRERCHSLLSGGSRGVELR